MDGFLLSEFREFVKSSELGGMEIIYAQIDDAPVTDLDGGACAFKHLMTIGGHKRGVTIIHPDNVPELLEIVEESGLKATRANEALDVADLARSLTDLAEFVQDVIRKQ